MEERLLDQVPLLHSRPADIPFHGLAGRFGDLGRDLRFLQGRLLNENLRFYRREVKRTSPAPTKPKLSWPQESRPRRFVNNCRSAERGREHGVVETVREDGRGGS